MSLPLRALARCYYFLILTGPTKHYDGEGKDEGQLSIIGSGYFVIISETDDKSVGDTAFTGETFDTKKQFSRYSVLPGMHTTIYRHYEFDARVHTYLIDAKTNKIAINTKISHSYTVGALTDKDNSDKKWKVFVSEKDINEVVTLEVPIKHLK